MNIELRVNQNHVSGRANVRFMYMHVYVNIAIMIVELEHFLAEQIVATSEKMILIDKNTRKSSLYCEIINNNKTCLLIFSMKTFDQTASLKIKVAHLSSDSSRQSWGVKLWRLTGRVERETNLSEVLLLESAYYRFHI